MSRPLRLAVLPVYQEEGWPSMDLCAEMLMRQLAAGHADHFAVQRLDPPFRHRFSLLPGLRSRRFLRNTDRLLNRMWDYPCSVARHRHGFDIFHICDHSYAQLAHVLPGQRTGVLCQDLDTFRCLLEPEKDRRPRWFLAMTRRILDGLQKVAVVFHTTPAMRAQIEQLGLIDPARLVHAPLGIAPEFTSNGQGPPPESQRSLIPDEPFLLHVGSCIPRKRIDVLLEVFAAVRPQHPRLLLVKVGGEWTPAQRERISQLGLGEAIIHRTDLSRTQLAALYRRAAVILVPSESEGFGLPVIEALACDAIVVASDLPTLRTAGADAALYAPVGNIPAWARCVGELLEKPGIAPPSELRQRQAQRYSWEAHARVIGESYLRLAGQ